MEYLSDWHLLRRLLVKFHRQQSYARSASNLRILWECSWWHDNMPPQPRHFAAWRARGSDPRLRVAAISFVAGIVRTERSSLWRQPRKSFPRARQFLRGGFRPRMDH